MTNSIARNETALPRPFDVIFYGALVAGTLDAIDGVVAYGFKGMNPIQVLQYIASGLLGVDAFKGGLATAGLGVLLHYFIAFVVALVYYRFSRWLPTLRNQPVMWGLTYGAAVYVFMNYLVLPLSAVPKSPFSLALFLNGIFGHALFVGLPIALFARRPEGKVSTQINRQALQQV
ncbi:MAG TPA: hypothetical protein VGU90_06365 [Terriglobales bacterium]|nr:hypothetical protein [Terriglobales bacterium]